MTEFPWFPSVGACPICTQQAKRASLAGHGGGAQGRGERIQRPGLVRRGKARLGPTRRSAHVVSSDGANQPVVMAYDVEPDGNLSNGRVFFESWGDGMAVDQQGNVYVDGSSLFITADMHLLRIRLNVKGVGF